MKTFNVTEGDGKLIIHIAADESNYSISYDHGNIIFEKEDRKYIIPETNATSIYTKRPNPENGKREYVFSAVRSLYRDILPDDFSISNITEVDAGTQHFTDEITVAGINDYTTVIIPNGVELYVNGSTVASGTKVVSGDKIKFKLSASGSHSTETIYNIQIGDMTKQFTIATNAGVLYSCKAWRDAGYTTDGIYTINVGGSEFEALCDMTRNDGGWTLVYKIADSSNMKSTGTVGDLTNLANSLLTDSYSGKLSDNIIKDLYSEQYKSEQYGTTTMFARFTDINTYADNVRVDKRTSTSYQSIANNYSTSHDGHWTHGFSAWGYPGQIITQLNYNDNRLGSHVAGGFNTPAADPGCTSNGGCHVMVWVR
jgi:hypothetical protein